MEDDAISILRHKYAKDLEEAIRCPVCYERPVGSVIMCIKGHHLCKKCKRKLTKCPLCQLDFSKLTRNLAVEELCLKFNDIVSSLLETPATTDPASTASTSSDINFIRTRSRSRQRRSVSTQTEQNVQTTASGLSVVNNEHLLIKCRIGFCPARLLPENMYTHVTSSHRENFTELTMLGRTFYTNWELEYDKEKLYDYAVHCECLGLLFVNVHIDRIGDLSITMQSNYNCLNKKFRYLLTITIPGDTIDFNGRLKACLSQPRKDILKRHFFKRYFKDDHITIDKDKNRGFLVSMFISLKG